MNALIFFGLIFGIGWIGFGISIIYWPDSFKYVPTDEILFMMWAWPLALIFIVGVSIISPIFEFWTRYQDYKDYKINKTVGGFHQINDDLD